MRIRGSVSSFIITVTDISLALVLVWKLKSVKASRLSTRRWVLCLLSETRAQWKIQLLPKSKVAPKDMYLRCRLWKYHSNIFNIVVGDVGCKRQWWASVLEQYTTLPRSYHPGYRIYVDHLLHGTYILPYRPVQLSICIGMARRGCYHWHYPWFKLDGEGNWIQQYVRWVLITPQRIVAESWALIFWFPWKTCRSSNWLQAMLPLLRTVSICIRNVFRFLQPS